MQLAIMKISKTLLNDILGGGHRVYRELIPELKIDKSSKRSQFVKNPFTPWEEGANLIVYYNDAIWKFIDLEYGGFEGDPIDFIGLYFASVMDDLIKIEEEEGVADENVTDTDTFLKVFGV